MADPKPKRLSAAEKAAAGIKLIVAENEHLTAQVAALQMRAEADLRALTSLRAKCADQAIELESSRIMQGNQACSIQQLQQRRDTLGARYHAAVAWADKHAKGNGIAKMLLEEVFFVPTGTNSGSVSPFARWDYPRL